MNGTLLRVENAEGLGIVLGRVNSGAHSRILTPDDVADHAVLAESRLKDAGVPVWRRIGARALLHPSTHGAYRARLTKVTRCVIQRDADGWYVRSCSRDGVENTDDGSEPMVFRMVIDANPGEWSRLLASVLAARGIRLSVPVEVRPRLRSVRNGG